MVFSPLNQCHCQQQQCLINVCKTIQNWSRLEIGHAWKSNGAKKINQSSTCRVCEGGRGTARPDRGCPVALLLTPASDSTAGPMGSPGCPRVGRISVSSVRCATVGGARSCPRWEGCSVTPPSSSSRVKR